MLMGVLFDVLTGCCDIGVHASTRRPEGQHAGRPAQPGDHAIISQVAFGRWLLKLNQKQN